MPAPTLEGSAIAFPGFAQSEAPLMPIHEAATDVDITTEDSDAWEWYPAAQIAAAEEAGLDLLDEIVEYRKQQASATNSQIRALAALAA